MSYRCPHVGVILASLEEGKGKDKGVHTQLHFTSYWSHVHSLFICIHAFLLQPFKKNKTKPNKD